MSDSHHHHHHHSTAQKLTKGKLFNPNAPGGTSTPSIDSDSGIGTMVNINSLSGLVTVASPTILLSLIALLHRFPDIFYPYTPTLAQLTIRLLDPQQPQQRKALLKHTTLLIHTLVNLYPNISFEKTNQRLLVSSTTHQIYIPKQASQSITGVNKSPLTSTLTSTPLDVFSTASSTTSSTTTQSTSSTQLTKQQQLSLQQFKEGSTVNASQIGSVVCYDLRSASKVRMLWDKTTSPITTCSISPLGGNLCVTYHAFESNGPILKLWSLPSTSVLGSFFHSNPKCIETYQLPRVNTYIINTKDSIKNGNGGDVTEQQLAMVLKHCKIKWEYSEPSGSSKKQFETCILTREDGSVIRYVCKD
jgi:hypothetical protein